MKPAVVSSLVLGAALAAGTALFLKTNPAVPPAPAGSNASAAVKATNDSGQAGASQVIEITAKGGYTPKVAFAKAGVPSVLEIKTDGTLDCSSALRIPELGWSQNLAPTGEVSIPVPAEEAGVTITGVCSMGMYNFVITFK